METTGTYPLLVLAPVLSLGATCLSHVLLARFMDRRRPYVSLLLAIAIGLAVVLVASVALLTKAEAPPLDAAAFVCLNAATYLALAFGYFSFANLCLTSLRIRMLRELHDAGGSLPEGQLATLYDDSRVGVLRIQRLIAGGHLLEGDDRLYQNGGLFLAIARLFDWLRWLVLGNDGFRCQQDFRSDASRTGGGRS